MEIITMDKQYRTRDGREVRIYAVDDDLEHPVIGAYKGDDRWYVTYWGKDGRWHVEEDYRDLIEVKPRIKRTVWLNINGDGVAGDWTRSGADLLAAKADYGRLACIKINIDCEEGEGL